MGLMDFLSMMDNYEDRKVDRLEVDKGFIIDTCSVKDSSKPFETAIMHPSYNEGEWVIVELYDNKEQSQEGHNKWVSIMTSKELPKTLKDVSTSEVSEIRDVLGGNEWRENKAQ